ncbi:MAG: type II toxin-antitoxin system HicA family toxin [Desulfobacterales bacterium]|nr:type II toxin-antitoxin system HicA family toxin [Desulfobacterales bacterium]
MKIREMIKILEQNGWYFVRPKGSHRQFKHPDKSGTVTIGGKPSLDLPPGTLSSILKQAELKK